MNAIINDTERIVLTDAQRVQLFEVGKLRWEEKDIAVFLGFPPDAFHREYADPGSEVSRLLRQGELTAQFEIEHQLYKGAKAGDPDSVIDFNKAIRDRAFRLTKLDLFGGAEDESLFENIQRYYNEGCNGDMSAKEQAYLEILQMTYSFVIQYGKRKAIKILCKPPYSLSYERAADIIAESIEMFNGGRRVTKEAMRHHLADSYDTLYHAMVAEAKTPKDFALAAQVLEKKAKLLQLDQPDEVPLDDGEYKRNIRLLSLDPGSIGLPKANRDELAAQIDALEHLTDAEAHRLKMDAGIIDTDIIGILENVAQEES